MLLTTNQFNAPNFKGYIHQTGTTVDVNKIKLTKPIFNGIQVVIDDDHSFKLSKFYCSVEAYNKAFIKASKLGEKDVVDINNPEKILTLQDDLPEYTSQKINQEDENAVISTVINSRGPVKIKAKKIDKGISSTNGEIVQDNPECEIGNLPFSNQCNFSIMAKEDINLNAKYINGSIKTEGNVIYDNPNAKINGYIEGSAVKTNVQVEKFIEGKHGVIYENPKGKGTTIYSKKGSIIAKAKEFGNLFAQKDIFIIGKSMAQKDEFSSSSRVNSRKGTVYLVDVKDKSMFDITSDKVEEITMEDFEKMKKSNSNLKQLYGEFEKTPKGLLKGLFQKSK